MKRLKFLVIILFIIACEDDEICLEELSPRLNVEFIDSVGERQSLDSIFVSILTSDDLSRKITSIDSANVDSLLIPLTDLSNPLRLIFVRSTGGLADTITINYTENIEYISKACGFKRTLTDLSFGHTSNQIININTNQSSLIDEQETHLSITY